MSEKRPPTWEEWPAGPQVLNRRVKRGRSHATALGVWLVLFSVSVHRTVHADFPHTALGLASGQGIRSRGSSPPPFRQADQTTWSKYLARRKAPCPLPRDFVPPCQKGSCTPKHESVYPPIGPVNFPLGKVPRPAHEYPVCCDNDLVPSPHSTLIAGRQMMHSC